MPPPSLSRADPPRASWLRLDSPPGPSLFCPGLWTTLRLMGPRTSGGCPFPRFLRAHTRAPCVPLRGTPTGTPRTSLGPCSACLGWGLLTAQELCPGVGAAPAPEEGPVRQAFVDGGSAGGGGRTLKGQQGSPEGGRPVVCEPPLVAAGVRATAEGRGRPGAFAD